MNEIDIEMQPVNDIVLQEQDSTDYNSLVNKPQINGKTVDGARNGAYYNLQDILTSSNKLNADYIDDSTSTNKLLTPSVRENIVFKNQSPTLSDGDSYEFIFQAENKKAHLQFHEDYGLELKSKLDEEDENEIALRNTGEINIKSCQYEKVTIESESGGKIEVNEDSIGFNITPSVNGKNVLVPENVTGYDATKTQVLKNVNGTLTWVDEI